LGAETSGGGGKGVNIVFCVSTSNSRFPFLPLSGERGAGDETKNDHGKMGIWG